MVDVTITLDKTHGRLSTREPFLLGENEDLRMNLVSTLALSNVLINFKNGDTVKQYRVAENPFIVPKEVVKHGRLDCEVNLVACGRVVKTYVVEPIVLYSVKTSLIGHPEFDLLLQHIEAQDAEIQTLKEQLNATKALADRTAQEVADLQRALEDN